jgi:D-sedoheptulose 7-phosphate isomerase
MSEGMDYTGFLGNRMVQDAVIRQFEIVGEATKNLSDTFREHHAVMPWKDLAGFRDKLIHQYFGVDISMVWKSLVDDVPMLLVELLKIQIPVRQVGPCDYHSEELEKGLSIKAMERAEWVIGKVVSLTGSKTSYSGWFLMDKLMDYTQRLNAIQYDFDAILLTGERILDAWKTGKQVFLCGNGGSAANAIHIANDLFYGAAKNTGKPGIASHALTANQAIVLCIANDFSYEEIFAEQLRAQGRPGDILVALSGSGNSENIVRAIQAARSIGMTSIAILGYTGGKCKDLADIPIHFAVDDMQISEDAQLIVGHMLMQWLREKIIQTQECQ